MDEIAVRTSESVHRTHAVTRTILQEFVVLPLVPLSPPQEGSVVKHVLAVGIQGPVVAFARIPRLAGNLYKAVVETEVVADGVLPHGILFFVVWKLVLDEIADPAQGQLLVR